MSMDMDMSGEGPTDYADYDYQVLRVEDKATNNSGSVNEQFLTTIEPLEAIGGLSNNEVAELVYMEVQATIEPEDESESQGVATIAEYRGVIGANIDVSGGLSEFIEP